LTVRVLHVDPERGWGGGEVQVALLVRELARRGHESVVAAPSASPLGQAIAGAGVRLVDCPIASHVDLRMVPRLRRLAHEVDVVHFHTARAHAMAPWLGGLGVRRIVTRRMDYAPRGGPWVRHLYNRAVDRVIAISGGVRAALVAAGVDPARIRVVPSGIDLDAFTVSPAARAALRHEWNVADADVVAIVVGVLEPRKGHVTLLDAATRLRDMRLRYVFCGTGSLDAALRADAAARGLDVRFLGFRDDVARCLAAADVAILPSLHEGLGVAALEAMAAGRPVVASRVGGLAEVVADGETGRLVPSGDPTALAAALASLASAPDVRARMGRAGLARVAAHYSSTAMAEGTLACYTEAP
jgi:glycosyltransferase involved in cell wall biosynthesis